MTKHTAHRYSTGYEYRGYWIERATAGQWNLYYGTEVDRLVPDIEALIDEGLPSLAAAKRAVDADPNA